MSWSGPLEQPLPHHLAILAHFDHHLDLRILHQDGQVHFDGSRYQINCRQVPEKYIHGGPGCGALDPWCRRCRQRNHHRIHCRSRRRVRTVQGRCQRSSDGPGCHDHWRGCTGGNGQLPDDHGWNRCRCICENLADGRQIREGQWLDGCRRRCHSRRIDCSFEGDRRSHGFQFGC